MYPCAVTSPTNPRLVSRESSVVHADDRRVSATVPAAPVLIRRSLREITLPPGFDQQPRLPVTKGCDMFIST
jgi:hypothetical protein